MEQTLSIIKPDAIERNLQDKIKDIFIKNNFMIVKEKKVKLEKKMQNNFIKFTKQNHSIMIYVIIYPQVLF